MEGLWKLLDALPIVSVHVMALVSVVIDAHGSQRITLICQQHDCIVDDSSPSPQKTHIDVYALVEPVSISRLTQRHAAEKITVEVI